MVKKHTHTHTFFIQVFSDTLVKYRSECDFKQSNRVLAVKREPKIHTHFVHAVFLLFHFVNYDSE